MVQLQATTKINEEKQFNPHTSNILKSQKIRNITTCIDLVLWHTVKSTKINVNSPTVDGEIISTIMLTDIGQ